MTQIMWLDNLAPDIQEELLFLPRTTHGRDTIKEADIRLAYRPGVEPTEAEQSVARSRIEELLFKAHQNAKQQDLAPGEIESAIDEAIQSADE